MILINLFLMKNRLRYVLYCTLYSGIVTLCGEVLLFFATFFSVPLFSVPLFNCSSFQCSSFYCSFFVPLFLFLFSVLLFSCSVPLFVFRSSFHVPFLFSVFLIFSVPGFPCSAHPRLLPKEMAEHLSPTQESPHSLHILMPVIRTWAPINRLLASFFKFLKFISSGIHFYILVSKNALKIYKRLAVRLKPDTYRDQKCFGINLFLKKHFLSVILSTFSVFFL